MKLQITTANKIENPPKNYGFAFIDAEDNKLKVKKYDSSIIEFNNDLSDIQLLDLTDYTAFEVFAHDYDIPVGECAELGGYVNVAIPANMTHVMLLRTVAENAGDCDAIVDWGDGSTSVIANGDYNKDFAYNQNKSFTVQHTYNSTGKYIVKVYGKTVYNIQHRSDISNGSVTSENYNLMCRCYDKDLPVASWMDNMSSFCRCAKRLLHINVSLAVSPSYYTNIGNICEDCVNLLEARGFSRVFQKANCEAAFKNCINMTYCDAVVPLSSLYQTACHEMFYNCSKMAIQIYNLIPSFWVGVTGLYFVRVFYNCSSLLGTSAPDSRLWNNTSIKWEKTTDAFAGCPEALRKNTPASWGGTANDNIIKSNVVTNTWMGTMDEYNALTVKDSQTLYLIKE
jgi:hypothetical protein